MAPLAGLLVAVAAGTNLPVPILLIYQQQMALTASQTAGLFGVYAAGLIPAVLVAGPASDRFGRRVVTIIGGLLAAVASLTFAFASEHVTMLFGVRWLQGVAAGVVFAVASAWIQEATARVEGGGARLTAMCMTGGFAGGSLVGGLWGQWWPAPLVAPYLLHALLCLVALGLAWSVPQVRRPVRTGDAGPVFQRGGALYFLLVMAPPALFVFGFPATAINTVPLLVGLPTFPVAATGALAGLTLGAGAFASPWQRRLDLRTVPTAGILGGIGMGLVALSTFGGSAKLLLVPAVVALGAGGGLALAGGLARVPNAAMPRWSGLVTAGFYAVAYLGFATPLLLASISPWVAPVSSFVVLALLCLLVAWLQWPRTGRAARFSPGAP